MKGLDEHGKDFKKIAALLKTRTATQVRDHTVSEDQREERRRLKKENMKQGSHVKAQRKNVTSSKKFHGNYRYFCSTENTGPKQQL